MASFFRTWLIRGGILAVIAAAAFAAWTALHWVGPEKVRAAVLAHLHAKFDDSVEVSLGSAQMRIFGGLSVSDLTLTRRGESVPFLVVPHAVIYHDKEKLSRGELEIRKIELTGPTVRLDRNADGTWSLSDLAPRTPPDRPLPTVLATDATVIVTDHRPDAPPAVALRHVKLTVLNDPLPVVKIDGQCVLMAAAALEPDGSVAPDVFTLPLTVSARVHRVTGQLTVHTETGELDVSPDLAPVLERLHPKAAAYCRQFSGKVAVKADVTTAGGSSQPLKYDVRVELRDGRFEDATLLPWPLDRLAGTVRVNDGKLTVEKMTGKLGKATAELTLESKADLLCPKAGDGGEGSVPGRPAVGPRWPQVVLAHRLVADPTAAADPCADPMAAIEAKLERFELKVLALSLDDDLFARLAPGAQKMKQMFTPHGAVDVTVRFTRPECGWRREVDVTPQGLGIEYEHFRYPITEMNGYLRKVNASDGTDEFRVKVSATAGGRRIAIDGKVAGEGPDPLVDLTIAGTDIPIDAKLIAALPPKYADALGKLRASARGNFHITVRREQGVNKFENTFKITVYNGAVNYTQFPYALSQVRGEVLIRSSARDRDRPIRPGQPEGVEPDKDAVELRNFEAVHDGGRLWVSGESKAVAGTKDRKLTLQVQGENCPIDAEFKAALKLVKLDGVATGLAPRGELTFGSDIEVWERSRPDAAPPPVLVDHPTDTGEVKAAVALLPAEPPFDPATDLKIAFHFRGPSVTPEFFPYDLHHLSGLLRYQYGRVEMLDFSARHGATTLKLGAADVRFADGGVWANLGNVQVSPLVADAQLLKALPARLRGGFERLNVRGSAELNVKHMVISVPGPNAAARPPGSDIQLVSAGTSAKPDRPWTLAQLPSLIALPPKAARPVPPDKPLVVTAAGLLPFTLPWQKPPAGPPSASPPPGLPDDLNSAVVYWNATLKLTGGALDAGIPWDDVYGSIASEGRFEGTHLGSVVGNAWFDKATIAKQPVSAAKVSYRIRPQQADPKRPGQFLPPVAEFRDLTATAFGGTVGGEARVTLDEPVRYRLWLTASGVKLEDLAAHHKMGSGELKGLAQGEVLLENGTDAKTGKPLLTGSGQIDVPQGRMYNLPVLLELVKVLKGQPPDGVAFDEAHATFELKGDRVKVTQLDLLGSAVSLGGSGELDTTGKDVKFEFYTIWSQTLRRWLTTPLGDVTGLLSGGLFKIELTRVNGTLTYKAHMLPAVTDPVRAVAERWRNRFGREPTPPPTVRGASR